MSYQFLFQQNFPFHGFRYFSRGLFTFLEPPFKLDSQLAAARIGLHYDARLPHAHRTLRVKLIKRKPNAGYHLVYPGKHCLAAPQLLNDRL
jgi:hypothetical protein